MTMDSGSVQPVPLSDLGRSGRAPKGGRLLAGAFSVTLHLLALVAIFWVHASPPPEPEDPC